MIGTTARAYEARDEADEPLSDNRCACGRRAAGYDARRGEATCEVCARLRTDGSDLEADAQHYLDGAGDMLETAATKADSDWLRGAIEEVRVDLAKLQGFQTAAELRGDRDDGIDRGDGIQTDGGEEIDEEFLERLESVELVRDEINRLQNEIEDLDIGLDGNDTERLLWARLTGWSLSDVRDTFDALEDVRTRSNEDLTIRLVAQLGDVNQKEAEEFLEECDRLRRKYGGSR